MGKNISEQMVNVLQERKSLVLSRSDGGSIVPVTFGNDFDAENQIIVPMVSGGDCFGSIVLFDKDKAARFSSADVKLVQLGCSFLSFQVE